MTKIPPSRALALVGMPGAGKTLCAEYLEKRGFFQFRFGRIVIEEVERRGQSITPENETTVREELRQNEGMDAVAKRALPYLQAALKTRAVIIIDGLYSFSEYRTLRKTLNAELILVAIVCPRALRYTRLTTRPIRPLTLVKAEQRDFQEIENLEKGGPIAMADYFLTNERDPQALYDQLDTLIERLGIAP